MASFSLITLQPDGYGHISAFNDIKLLLYFSLLDLGHEVSLATNRFPEGSTPIIFGAHLISDSFPLDLPSGCILFNTEQLGPMASPWSDRILSLAQQHIIWDYSSFNLQHLLNSHPGVGAYRCRLGYHQQLQRIRTRLTQPEGFIFYGSITPLRQEILGRIRLSERLKVSAYFGMYGWQRDGLLARARAVLNLHSQPCRVLEWVRMLPLLANAIPCIALVHAETRSDDAQLSYLLQTSEQDPTEELEGLYESVDRLREHGQTMQQRFREQEQQQEFTHATLDATFSSSFQPAPGPPVTPAWCDSPARRKPDPQWYPHVYHWINDPRDIVEFHLQEGWQRQYHPDAKFAEEFQPPVWLHDSIAQREKPVTQALAVVLHFHHELNARIFFANFGRFLVHQADFFMTTSSSTVAATLQTLAQEYEIKNATILTTANRGRDLPSKYIYFASELGAYDLCFFSHGKQSNHAWFHDHNQILAGSEERIAAIKDLFQADASLGLVFPDYLPSLSHLIGWDQMRRQVDALLEPQGWDSRDVALLEFPAGGFFWARPAALRPIFDLNLSSEQMPEEPLPRDNSLLHAIERLPCMAAERAGYRWIKLARSRQEGQPPANPPMQPPAAGNGPAQEPSFSFFWPSQVEANARFDRLHIDTPAPERGAADWDPLESQLRQAQDSVSLLHFHHYDPGGYLPLSWRQLLSQARSSGFSLLITSCSGFDDESLEFINRQELLALRRPNVGGCLGALRDVALMTHHFQSQGLRIAKLLFLNDSILPARSSVACLQNLLQLSELCVQQRPCLAGFTESLERGHHLQSYALVANESLLADISWMLFWSAFDPTLTGQDLIDKGEIPLSSDLASTGVRLAVLYPLFQRLLRHPGCLEELKPFGNLDLTHLNPTMFLSQTLRQCGFCFIKKKRLLQCPLSLPFLHEVLGDLEAEPLQMIIQDLTKIFNNKAKENHSSNASA